MCILLSALTSLVFYPEVMFFKEEFVEFLHSPII